MALSMLGDRDAFQPSVAAPLFYALSAATVLNIVAAFAVSVWRRTKFPFNGREFWLVQLLVVCIGLQSIFIALRAVVPINCGWVLLCEIVVQFAAINACMLRMVRLWVLYYAAQERLAALQMLNVNLRAERARAASHARGVSRILTLTKRASRTLLVQMKSEDGGGGGSIGGGSVGVLSPRSLSTKSLDVLGSRGSRGEESGTLSQEFHHTITEQTAAGSSVGRHRRHRSGLTSLEEIRASISSVSTALQNPEENDLAHLEALEEGDFFAKRSKDIDSSRRSRGGADNDNFEPCGSPDSANACEFFSHGSGGSSTSTQPLTRESAECATSVLTPTRMQTLRALTLARAADNLASPRSTQLTLSRRDSCTAAGGNCGGVGGNKPTVAATAAIPQAEPSPKSVVEKQASEHSFSARFGGANGASSAAPKRWFSRRKRWVSTPTLARAFALLMALELSLVGTQYFLWNTSHPTIFEDAQSCPSVFVTKWLLSACEAVTAIAFMATGWKIRNVQDGYHIRDEFKYLGLCAAFIIPFLFAHGRGGFDHPFFITNFFVPLGYQIFTGIMIYFPAYLGYERVAAAANVQATRTRQKKLWPSRSDACSEVWSASRSKGRLGKSARSLEDLINREEYAEELESFEQHLTREFSIENMMAYKDIMRFERMDHASMTDSDMGVAALNIFMTYIREGATNETNIDHKTRCEILKALADRIPHFSPTCSSVDAFVSNIQIAHELRTTGRVPTTLFTPVRRHVYSLMSKDVFPRWQQQQQKVAPGKLEPRTPTGADGRSPSKWSSFLSFTSKSEHTEGEALPSRTPSPVCKGTPSPV